MPQHTSRYVERHAAITESVTTWFPTLHKRKVLRIVSATLHQPHATRMATEAIAATLIARLAPEYLEFPVQLPFVDPDPRCPIHPPYDEGSVAA